MNDRSAEARARAVPSGRLSRLARLGGMATGIAGAMAWDGAREVARGRRPGLRDLFLTPGNVARIADELARMRGAAMKLGQLVSMDAGDMLPPELAAILARLRDRGDPMPPAQLKAALTAAWGRDWQRGFARFDVRPLAAASIGQVHRARTRDGRDLAIKVQYPGVARSIDSDIANVAALIAMSGLVPPGLDLAPLMAEARRQLHEEADYLREGARLRRFGALLADSPDFAVPRLAADLTTDRVLAMSHAAGHPVEDLAGAPQRVRDRAATRLIGLMLREVFEFRLVQSDPNFANYRHDPETGRLILLDFGAVCAVPDATVAGCRRLLRAGLAGDRDALRAAATDIGLLPPDAAPRHAETILDTMAWAFAAMTVGPVFDVADRDFAARLRRVATDLAADRDFGHVAPVDMLHLQRKAAGLYLLASRLGARVDLRALLGRYA